MKRETHIIVEWGKKEIILLSKKNERSSKKICTNEK